MDEAIKRLRAILAEYEKERDEAKGKINQIEDVIWYLGQDEIPAYIKRNYYYELIEDLLAVPEPGEGDAE